MKNTAEKVHLQNTLHCLLATKYGDAISQSRLNDAIIYVISELYEE